MENNMKIIRTTSKRVVLFVMIPTAIIFGMCAYPIVSNIVKSPSYVKVEAKIIAIDSDSRKGTTTQRYVSYGYSYNGVDYQKKEVTSYNIYEKGIGSTVYIRINPKKPLEIQNTYFINSLIFPSMVSGFSLFFLICCLFTPYVDLRDQPRRISPYSKINLK